MSQRTPGWQGAMCLAIGLAVLVRLRAVVASLSPYVRLTAARTHS